MSQVPHALQLALDSLSPKTAQLLEQTVLHAIQLASAAERVNGTIFITDKFESETRDHSAFLNSYAFTDEGLYDDC